MYKPLFNRLLCTVFCVISATVVASTEWIDKPAPVCELTTLNGEPVDGLEALQGKVVYLDFWASWCLPCLESFPFMNQLHRDLGQQGLQIVGVNLDEKPADASAFLDKYTAEFTIVADPTKQCAKNYSVIAMPSSYLIDRAGIVRYVHRGFRSGETEQLRAVIEHLLHHQP